MLLTKAHVRKCPHFNDDLLGQEPSVSMIEFLAKFSEPEDQEICFGRLMEVMQDYLHSIRVQIGLSLIEANGGSGLSLELSDEKGALAVVFPEPSARGGYRVSFYDVNGPITHELFSSVDECVLHAIKLGYRNHAPGRLDQLTDLRSWRRGVKWASLLLRYHGNPYQFLLDNPDYLDS
ncbi:hypothetical protein [Aeromonas caviae]|uniref:hypothetical protein n=1 Tax=Aeromonas caviae TaxID=648 RepID=UPI0029D61FAB|nr:hypothetical protein [Aeromonas caviae]MDX7767273.1 hypothetical protein [Aeromonas caviae]